MSTKFFIDDCCFACGKENKNGLKLKIVETENGVESKIILPGWTQGYRRIVHGGIVSTILDEMAVWAAITKGHKSATVELKIRLKKAMFVDEEYIASGWLLGVKNRIVTARAEIRDKDNVQIARAEVKLFKLLEETG